MMFFASVLASFDCQEMDIEPVPEGQPCDTVRAEMLVSEHPSDTIVFPTLAISGYVVKNMKDSTITYLGANKQPISSRWIVWGYLLRS